MRVIAGIAAVLIAATPAQAQSRPESRADTRAGLESLRPVMAKIQADAADVEGLRRVVEALLRSEHAIAAPWWISEYEDAERDEKTLALEREAVAKLRHECERSDVFPDVRKLMLRVVRESESRVANKDVEGARQAVAVAEGMLALVPDSTLAKLVDAAGKKLPPPKPDDAPEKPAAPWPASLGSEAKAGCRRLVDLGIAAYQAAGCAQGRRVLAASIRRLAPILGPEDAAAALARLRELAKQVEPASALVVFVRTVGSARFFRNGEPLPVIPGGATFDASSAPPVEIAVLPGDVVTIALDEPYSFDSIGNSFVVALNARTESKDLGAKDMACDVAEKPGQPGATLYPLPLAKKKPDPPKSLFGRSPEQDQDLKRFNTYFELPKLLERSVDVPCLADMIGFGKEFEARKLAPIWIGAEAQRFAVAIKVPGP